MEKRLQELIRIGSEDMVLDKSALDQESVNIPKLHNKWLKFLFERKDVLFAAELKKKNVYKRLWLYYNGKAPDSEYKEKGSFDIRVLKADVNFFIDSDEEMQAIDAKIFSIKQEIEFITKTLEEIQRRSFNVSNALRALAFLNGMN